MAVDALEYDEVTKLACVEIAGQLLGIKAREEGGRGKFPSFLPSFLARLSRSCAMAVDALEYDEVAKAAWQQFEVEKGELMRANKEEGEVPFPPFSRAQRVRTRVTR